MPLYYAIDLFVRVLTPSKVFDGTPLSLNWVEQNSSLRAKACHSMLTDLSGLLKVLYCSCCCTRSGREEVLLPLATRLITWAPGHSAAHWTGHIVEGLRASLLTTCSHGAPRYAC